MKLKWNLLIILTLLISPTAFAEQLLVLEAKVPGQYIYDSQVEKNSTKKAVVVIHRDGPQARLIKEIISSPAGIQNLRVQADSNPSKIQWMSLKSGNRWDIIYPGLINLHNHTKQNIISVWDLAKGQFANRFEWRPWSGYTDSVSGNMNPWIGYGRPATCAAFRWSELQSMSVGTTYLQGDTKCVQSFGIQRVEETTSYKSARAKLQTPTDLIVPGDFVFLWNTLGPRIRELQKKYKRTGDTEAHHLAYEEAVAEVINKHCDFSHMTPAITINKHTVRYTDKDREDGALQVLKDKKALAESCDKDNLPPKFIRYLWWVHKGVVGKKKYVESIQPDPADGNGASFIVHLAEGRRHDHYNQKEWEMVELMGLIHPHVNFVHGLGISQKGLKTMGENQMGIIWSPYSNLLLYGETLDIQAAMENKVKLALGSDWLPTGSKGPLEEAKLAVAYLEKMGLDDDVVRLDPQSDSVDEAIFRMMAENPAKMISHWQGPTTDRWANGEMEGGVGTLAPGAMGTVIAVSQKDSDPFVNIVRKIWETDVNLVVIDGAVQYGNVTYMENLGLKETEDFEVMPNLEHDMENIAGSPFDNVPPTLNHVDNKPKKEEKLNLLVQLGQWIQPQMEAGLTRGELNPSCVFSDPKGKALVHQNSLSLRDNEDLREYQEATGLNLDRFKDIQRLLGGNLMTQSRNRNNPEDGNTQFLVKDFSTLFTCNSPKHKERLVQFISSEMDTNIAQRNQVREEQGHGSVPKNLAEKYPNF